VGSRGEVPVGGMGTKPVEGMGEVPQKLTTFLDLKVYFYAKIVNNFIHTACVPIFSVNICD